MQASRVINQLAVGLFFSSFLFTIPDYAHSMDFSDGNIEIKADKLQYDEGGSSIVATGNVEVTRDNTLIMSDKLVYDEAEKNIVATGNVRISDDGNLIEGDTLEYDVKNEKPSIINGKIFIKEDNYYITGKKITKTGENKYFVKSCSFTTCDGESPDWIIRADKVNLELGEYLFAKHPVLYVKNMPLIYLPWIAVPVKTDRQSGLLFPEIGYSEQYGFIFRQPFFWAISRSKDATISLNYMAEKADGADVEYRYVRSSNSGGTINVEYVNEHSPLNVNRWFGNARHREDFSNSLYGVFDFNFASDRTFLRDYGEEVNVYTTQRLESTASLLKSWDQYSMLTRFKYYKNLLSDDKTTLQRFPEVIVSGKRSRFGQTPLFFQVNSRFDNFWREGPDAAANLYSGQRLDLNPSISMPMSPSNMFDLTPQIGFRETIYYTDGKKEQVQTRSIYDFRLDFSIPFKRVYSIGGDAIKKMKHTIEPELAYTYVPHVDQSDLPVYDGLDNIVQNESMRFGLNNFIVTKIEREGLTKYHRLAYLKLYRDYDIIESRRALISVADRRRPWGPVRGQLNVTGEKWYRVDSDIQYDTYDDKITYFSAGLSALGNKNNKLDISYIYTAAPEVRYINAGLRYGLTETIDVAYKERFSVIDEYSLEKEYGILLEKQCWSLSLTYSHRRFPDEKLYYLSVKLNGLGTVGSEKGLFAR